jgi:hypothetical protein
MGRSYQNEAESRLGRPRARAEEHAFRLTLSLVLRYLELLCAYRSEEGDELKLILKLLEQLRLFMGPRKYRAAMLRAFEQYRTACTEDDDVKKFLRSTKSWTEKLRYPPDGNP